MREHILPPNLSPPPRSTPMMRAATHSPPRAVERWVGAFPVYTDLKNPFPHSPLQENNNNNGGNNNENGNLRPLTPTTTMNGKRAATALGTSRGESAPTPPPSGGRRSSIGSTTSSASNFSFKTTTATSGVVPALNISKTVISPTTKSSDSARKEQHNLLRFIAINAALAQNDQLRSPLRYQKACKGCMVRESRNEIYEHCIDEIHKTGAAAVSGVISSPAVSAMSPRSPSGSPSSPDIFDNGGGDGSGRGNAPGVDEMIERALSIATPQSSPNKYSPGRTKSNESYYSPQRAKRDHPDKQLWLVDPLSDEAVKMHDRQRLVDLLQKSDGVRTKSESSAGVEDKPAYRKEWEKMFRQTTPVQIVQPESKFLRGMWTK